ncbi:hypothetical protein [Acidipila sp. EB88]|uniref:hypothetical protein n=1 Tax=Acidipila sp. EB88 TaxID=2305226 RepID=UPI000F5D7E77|nr:hypothetical protein [Acidipila sp. EB88]RRA49328.1 hypothetical protein D1Y84_14635 [Acidipila sp. EB88]
MDADDLCLKDEECADYEIGVEDHLSGVPFADERPDAWRRGWNAAKHDIELENADEEIDF